VQVELVTGPAIEPISLGEAKIHLRYDGGTFGDQVTSVQSIAPGSHAIAAGYTLIGTGVDVLGYDALVLLESGTNGAGATVDVKIQDSDDNVTFVDWTGGAFTQITEDGVGATEPDNATYEIEYTGIKQYIRVVCTVAVDACEFGVSVVKNAPTSTEDDLITSLIVSAREHVEDILRKKLITQKWNYYLDEWPSENYIKLPFGNLQSNVKATGTITSSGVNVSNFDTVTIDTKTYRFRNVPVVEGDIDIGADAAESLDNLKAAINHTGTPGSQYVCADAHPTVEATTNTDTVQTLESIIGGVDGNTIALTTTAVTYTASGATLTGGITSAEIKYFDTDGLATVINVTTDYIMEFNGEQCGRIVLPYGETWPSGTLFPSNPIVVKFTCGYGDNASDVPYKIRAAILMLVAKLFESRGEDVIGQSVYEDKTVLNLLQSRRLWDEFV